MMLMCVCVCVLHRRRHGVLLLLPASVCVLPAVVDVLHPLPSLPLELQGVAQAAAILYIQTLKEGPLR